MSFSRPFDVRPALVSLAEHIAQALQPRGNDGLTDRERDSLAASYAAGVGATPVDTQHRRERLAIYRDKFEPRTVPGLGE